ncbi:MAG TPA: hypothetical protein VK849_01550, partial [Longimicrobiales bacterium]|nr:hypothetical protein [Longimicrobiales bacterium]
MPAERPPRLAVRLVGWRLPEELAEAIAGDLNEEYRARRRSGAAPLASDLWYWAQALGLRGGALRRISRRLRSMRPTW